MIEFKEIEENSDEKIYEKIKKFCEIIFEKLDVEKL